MGSRPGRLLHRLDHGVGILTEIGGFAYGGRPHTVEVTDSNPAPRGPAGREPSRSAAGGAVPHDAGNDSFDPIAPAGEGKERAWGSKGRDLFRATDCRWVLDCLGARSRKVEMNE